MLAIASTFTAQERKSRFSSQSVRRNANYRQIPQHLLSQVPFEGNSMSAYHDHNGDYIVLSYSTEIARVKAGTAERVFNDRKYSTTTSRHQNLVHAYL